MSEATKTVLSIRPHPQAIVAAVVCRHLTHETTLQLRSDLDAAIASAPSSPLFLDMSQVEFLPSMAIGMLVSTHKALKQSGRKCLLIGIRPLVLESLQITALDRFFEIHSTIEEGLKHL